MREDDITEYAKRHIGDDSDGVPLLKRAIDIIVMQREQLFGGGTRLKNTVKDFEKLYWEQIGRSVDLSSNVWDYVIKDAHEARYRIKNVMEESTAKKLIIYELDNLITALENLFPHSDT